MKGFIRTLFTGVIVFAVVLAIWKMFGGDVGGFFAAVWSFLYSVIDGISNVFVQIFGIFFK
jgi:hypothetical protein